MSRFFSSKYEKLVPYTPGEQPKDSDYIKLNTNESPFPPSPAAQEYAKAQAQKLELYPDPECAEMTDRLAEMLGVQPSQILLTNGSDEILNFAFMAYCDSRHPAAFPDITYGFYRVFAEINNIPYEEIPLNHDFTINIADYLGINKTIFIANPNAPTGIPISLLDIEEILKSNPDNIVVIDEAYVDFGGESSIGLTNKYDNLLVTGTFSKSRSMAGARLGFGIANEALISDLNTIKYSTNPYNINRMTMAAGLGAVHDSGYTEKNCRIIIETREYTRCELEKLGFYILESKANFLFVKSPDISGEGLYRELKRRGILVRHFTSPRISDFNRITIGTKEQMKVLIKTIKSILEEK